VGGWVDSVHLGDMQTAWVGVLCGWGGACIGKGEMRHRGPCSLTRGRRVGEGEGANEEEHFWSAPRTEAKHGPVRHCLS